MLERSLCSRACSVSETQSGYLLNLVLVGNIYLTSLESWSVLLKKIGSLRPFIILFLVNGIIIVLLGLI
jgi:hypothetical protein